MLKLLKYNFKESTRILGPCLLIMSLLNIFFYDLTQIIKSDLVPVFLVLTNIVIVVVILYHLTTSFIKEFNEDRGFLTFTLPISGKKFILAKLFNTTIWIILIVLVQAISAIILAFRLDSLKIDDFHFDISLLQGDIKSLINLMVFGFFTILVLYIYFMLSGYFSETISKIAYRGKSKFTQFVIAGTLWLTQFIVLLNITIKTAIAMPLYYNAVDGKFNLSQESISMFLDQGFVFTNINITGIIMLGLISVAYFFGMACLIDNKVDL